MAQSRPAPVIQREMSSGRRRRAKRERHPPNGEERNLTSDTSWQRDTPYERIWSVATYLSPMAVRSRTALVYLRRNRLNPGTMTVAQATHLRHLPRLPFSAAPRNARTRS